MKRESWIAIVGLSIAGAVLIISQHHGERLDAEIGLLQEACEEWVIHPYNQARIPTFFETYPIESSTDGRVISIVAMEPPTAARLKPVFALPLEDGATVMLPSCDYYMPEGAELPVQKNLVAARSKRTSAKEDAEIMSMIIGALSMIPFIWFFLLERLQEIGNAVRGKPPR